MQQYFAGKRPRTNFAAMRKWITLSPGEPLKLEAALLALTADFEEAVVLSDRWSQPQGWYQKLQRFSLLAGLGALESHQGPLAQLGRALDKDDWYLGHLSYKLQEELFPLQPKAAREQIPFAPLSLFPSPLAGPQRCRRTSPGLRSPARRRENGRRLHRETAGAQGKPRAEIPAATSSTASLSQPRTIP